MFIKDKAVSVFEELWAVFCNRKAGKISYKPGRK